MSSFFKKQVLLAFGLMASSLSVNASNYQYKRLNGTVMPSTGESKTVTIEVPVSKIPLYVFVDYNGQIPLSQRLELSSEQNKIEVTLLPVSQNIAISVIPQSDVHTYLNSVEKNRIQQDGVVILGGSEPLSVVQSRQEMQKNMKPVANILYDKIVQGQVIALPNPFEEVIAEEPSAEKSSEEKLLVEAEQPLAEQLSAEEPLVQEPLIEESEAKEPEAEESEIQPEMMQPNVSDMQSEESDASDKDVENKDVENVESKNTEDQSQENESKEKDESHEDMSKEDESKENESEENEL
ncbi:MAG: hypothetical protein WC747_00975 [Candidatus Babeliales bacterium]|jgi:hypothetical protein